MYIKETYYGYGVFRKGRLVTERYTYDECLEYIEEHRYDY